MAHAKPSTNTDTSLLLELQVPFRARGGKLLVEAQALNGLARWAEHFKPVTVCAPVVPESEPDDSTVTWADPSALLASGAVRFAPLPWGYHPVQHFKHLLPVHLQFRKLIAEHRYLCFSNVGGFGAWGNVGATVARLMNRPYSLWFDWVIHEMLGSQPGDSWKRKAKQAVERTYATVATHQAIRGAALGLFHGKTVFDAYAPYCKAPELVHDVHVKPEDAIGDGELAHKLAELDARKTIRIGYAGRAHPMKDPLAWVETVIKLARALGPERVEATWVGDGPLLEQMKQRVRAEGLEPRVKFPGFLSDRTELLSFLRSLDVFLFCHITPESPRCLLESVISATPLVGFESAFARDVVGDRGGALFAPIHGVDQLAAHLSRLADDRKELHALVEQAATSRPLYNDKAVFAHRSELIKAHLP